MATQTNTNVFDQSTTGSTQSRNFL